MDARNGPSSSLPVMGLFPSQMVSMAHRGMCSAQLHQNKYFTPLCCRCCFSIYVRNGFNYIFYLLGQVRGVQTQKYLICILPVKPSSSQSPGFQTAVDEERTTSFLLIILSSILLGVWGYLKGREIWKLHRYVCVFVRVCIYCSRNDSETALTQHPLQLRANHPPLWLTAICFL